MYKNVWYRNMDKLARGVNPIRRNLSSSSSIHAYILQEKTSIHMDKKVYTYEDIQKHPSPIGKQSNSSIDMQRNSFIQKNSSIQKNLFLQRSSSIEMQRRTYVHNKEDEWKYHGCIGIKKSKNGLVHIHLNRPEKLNCMNYEMVTNFSKLIMPLEDDPSCTIILLTGEGEKSFCAGGDVQEIIEQKEVKGYSFFEIEYATIGLIQGLAKPYVSIWDGFVMGGGCGLSMHGAYRVATNKTMFSMPETRIGFFPDVGATHAFSKLPYEIGMYLGLTGAKLNAADLHKLGLSTHYIDHAKVDTLVAALEEEPLTDTATVVAEEVLSRFGTKPVETPNICEEKYLVIKKHMSPETKSMKHIMASLKADSTKEANDIVKELEEMCPTSLCSWFSHYNKMRGMDFAACMAKDIILSINYLYGSRNFQEGVRAFIIEKDRKPKWEPKTVDEVRDEDVDRLERPVLDRAKL